MSKQTLKNIAKNLKKSSKVHAKQSKQIENIMKKSPTLKKKRKKRPPLPPAPAPKPITYPGGLKRVTRKKGPNLGRLKPTTEKKTKLGRIKNPKNSRLIPNVANETAKKTSPALAKLSASCKAAAKRKFKVYPSAYANMWAAKTQRQGKC